MSMLAFTMLLGAALGALGIIGWMFTTWIQVKNGYTVQGADGAFIGPARESELLAQENQELRGKITRLEERLSVLERIATDPAHRLDREIAGLR